MTQIVIDFSGWLKIQPENAVFQNTDTEKLISGTEWLNLTEDDRENYVLESVIDALKTCSDNEWTDIQILNQDTYVEDDESDSPEKAQKDSLLTQLDYEDGVFRKFFTTPFLQYKKHIGKMFTVIKTFDIEDSKGDKEDAYLIRLEDGTEIEAFAHEVCVLIYDKCK